MRLGTVAVRSLLKRPGRTIFSILGIGMGIAIVVGIFTLDHNTILGLSSPGDPDWQADIRVSPSREIADPRAELSGMPGVAGVSAFFQNEVDLLVDEDRPSRRIRLFGIESGSIAAETFYRVIRGRELAPDTPGGVLIGAKLAEEFALEVGSTISLERPRRGARKLCVDGEIKTLEPKDQLPTRIREFTVSGVLAAEKLGRRSNGEVVIVEFEAAQDLFADVLGSIDYVLEKSPDVDIERLTSKLGRAFSYELNKDVIIGQAAEERAFRNGVRFAGLMALGLGLYVIFHVLSIALVERSREIATLHALGATRGQVARIFVTEALILAGGGGALGLLGGLLLAHRLLAWKITTLGSGHDVGVFDVPWATVIPLVLVGCGIALMGSVFPLFRMRRADLSRTIRGDRSLDRSGPGLGFRLFATLLVAVAMPILFLQIAPLLGEKEAALQTVLYLGITVFALLVGLPLIVPTLLGSTAALLLRGFARVFPLGSMVAAREVARRPLRLAVGAAVLAMVTAAFTVMQGITGSLKADIAIWADAALDQRLFALGLNDAEMAKIEGVARRQPGYLAHQKSDLRAYVPFLLSGLNEDQAAAASVLQEDGARREFFGGRSLVVSTRLARDQGIQVGDSMPIRLGSGAVESFKVLAISDAVGYFPYPDERIYALTSEEIMRRDFCLDLEHAAGLAFTFDHHADIEATRRGLARDLQEELGLDHRPWIVTGPQMERRETEDIDDDFLLFDIIILLTAALGGLGVLNGQLLSALERSRELGVLKALGCRKRQMAGLILIEALTIGLLGGLLGAALGVLLNPVVIEALQIVSAFDLPLTDVTSRALLGILGALAVSLLSALYPMVKVVRTPVARAVREG